MQDFSPKCLFLSGSEIIVLFSLFQDKSVLQGNIGSAQLQMLEKSLINENVVVC